MKFACVAFSLCLLAAFVWTANGKKYLIETKDNPGDYWEQDYLVGGKINRDYKLGTEFKPVTFAHDEDIGYGEAYGKDGNEAKTGTDDKSVGVGGDNGKDYASYELKTEDNGKDYASYELKPEDNGKTGTEAKTGNDGKSLISEHCGRH